MRDLHSSALPNSAEGRRQDQLRKEGTRLVLGVLQLLGLSYEGTGGWHLVACCTPNSRLGFVNTTRGLALETELVVTDELLEALTVPEQGSGQVASGAAAWSSPDLGGPKRATVPRSWVQLLVDVRTGTTEPAMLSMAEVNPRMVGWCLPTVYGRRGMPGGARLDGEGTLLRVPTDEWPFTREQAERCIKVGAPWFSSLLDRMGEPPQRPDWVFIEAAQAELAKQVGLVAVLARVEGTMLPVLAERLGSMAQHRTQLAYDAIRALQDDGRTEDWQTVLEAVARTIVAEMLEPFLYGVKPLLERLLEAYAGEEGHVAVDIPQFP